MRFRTLAVAALLACGLTVMAEAKQKATVHRSGQKGAVHRTARKGPVRKSNIKAHKTARMKPVKVTKHTRKHLG
jgi:hypothetical protein